MIACASVCVLFCKYLTSNELLTPGKEGCLSSRFSRAVCGVAEYTWWVELWVNCSPQSPVNSVRNVFVALCSWVWSGKGEMGSRGRVEMEDQTEFSGN